MDPRGRLLRPHDRRVKLPEPVSRSTALADGYCDREIQRLCDTGLWQRVKRGQYVQTARDLSAEQRHKVLTAAVVRTVSADAVVSHVSAAVLHGLPLWSVSLAKVHVTRSRKSGGRVGRQVVRHSATLAPSDVVVIDGIRVTSVARTLIDLGCSIPLASAVIVGDAALRSGLVTRGDLESQLVSMSQRPGSRAARRMIAALDGRSESPGESRSRLLLKDWAVPELQAEVSTPQGVTVARVDFLFAQQGVIGEFDGMVKYRAELRGGRSAEQVVIAEKVREDRLRTLGWAVVRWTWAELDNPRALFARLDHGAAIGASATRVGTWTAPPRL